MTFRVYVRWNRQRVTDKTVTENRDVAELAYEQLIHRPDLVNTSAGVAFTEDGKQLRFHQFGDARPGLEP